MSAVGLTPGVFMILQHSVGKPGAFSADLTAVLMTVILAILYFGSRKD